MKYTLIEKVIEIESDLLNDYESEFYILGTSDEVFINLLNYKEVIAVSQPYEYQIHLKPFCDAVDITDRLERDIFNSLKSRIHKQMFDIEEELKQNSNIAEDDVEFLEGLRDDYNSFLIKWGR